ncbi:hypothetical protein CW304_26110 [Bacillus sp. UFRGS-B20]|nr:hypothetical protein CW304_26110 [Bacillus sp. UFRGS-B20]
MFLLIVFLSYFFIALTLLCFFLINLLQRVSVRVRECVNFLKNFKFRFFLYHYLPSQYLLSKTSRNS